MSEFALTAVTAVEYVAAFKPARFRLDTFDTILRTLPVLTEETDAVLSVQHRAVVDLIAGAELAVSVEVHDPSLAGLSRVDWYSGPSALVECCHLVDQVITTTWPAGDDLLIARLAVAINFTEAAVNGWGLPDESDRLTVPLSTSDVALLRSGTIPQGIAETLAPVRNVTRMWSFVAGAEATESAYDSTIVLTETGPWSLEPADQPYLRQLHPIDVWRELALTIAGFEEASDEEELA